MGKQEAFARTEVARFVTSNNEPRTSNTKSEAILLGIRIQRRALSARRWTLVPQECQGGDSNP